MSSSAIVLDGNTPRPLASARSHWRRAVTFGLGAGLVFLLAGDRGARTAVPSGIDPLEVLNLQVRANAIIVLDSSGSMRERTDCVDASGDGTCNSTQEGEVAGDDENGKMYTAKQVLKSVITQNQTKVSFQFGRYAQAAINAQGGNYQYIYTCLTAPPTGSTEQACVGTTGTSPVLLAAEFTATGLGTTGLTRTANTDTRTVTGGGTTFLLGSANYHVNQRYKVQDPATGNVVTLCSAAAVPSGTWAPPTPATDWNLVGKDQPFIEFAHYPSAQVGCSGTPSNVVRFYFRGIRWVKGNDINGSGPPFSAPVSCGGFASQVPLAACNDDDQISTIGPFLEPEVVATPNDNETLTNLRPAARKGIRASGPTPINESLINIRTAFGTSTTSGMWGTGTTPIKNMSPKPSTFVIVVTDGDDTCINATQFDSSPSLADPNARRAAYAAQQLYAGISGSGPGGVGVDPASQVKTFVVALGSSADVNRANMIAWGGSGMVRTASSGAWVSNPTDKTGCPTCVDAFLAANADDLADALQSAIDQGQSTGEFSDQQSITESVYEFAASVTLPSPSPGASAPPAPDPLNPSSRYSTTVPVLLQSTFELPIFKGHLNAFRNDGTATAAPAWSTTIPASDAGQKLQDRVTTSLSAPPYSFAQLRGGNSPLRTDADIRLGAAGTIKRRIYTTARNGVFLNTSIGGGTRSDAQRVTDLQDNNPANGGAPTFRVPIWPPTTTSTALSGVTAVDPDATAGSAYPAGLLDNALGIGAAPMPPPTGGTAPAALTFAQLQTTFGACTSSNGVLPTDCGSTNATLKLAAARKEARQIILAWAAGADLVAANKLATRRKPTSTCTVSTTIAAGDLASNGIYCGALQFQPRQWIMAESTLAAPGVVTAPLELSPPASQHDGEYALYRDGPRTTGASPAPQNPDTSGASILNGLGLRNPDKDGPTGADTARMRLKPVMSVVYHATNGMLHALRAGPCRDSSSGTTCLDGTFNAVGGEKGGEELWAFVPFDQLQNLKGRMKPQTRDPHTYMIATPIRFSDVFVPGTWSRSYGSVSVGGDGAWRTFIVFGRGIAGKYYTALDVTAPGPFTEGSLSTKAPIPIWSRGNPDTQDLTTGGTANNSAADATAYLKMGQTWSVPAIANVDPAANTTARTSTGVEWVAYTGSGFGAASEGSTFFTLDMLTGDVVASADVGDRASAPYDNAIVAGPSAFNAEQLTPPNMAKISVTRTTRVYVPDNNGRIWKVMSSAPGTATLFADFGADQPIGNSVALLNYKGSGTAERPHIFAETGNDNRITPPPASTPPFHMYGLRDDDLTTNQTNSFGVTGPAIALFRGDFPDGFRGNVAPATAFNDQTPPLGRVFFVGNKFNPIDATATSCVSSFDAILFALGAESGNAAYDLNASGQDLSVTKTGQRIQAVRVAGGRLVLDTGLQADIAPPPPAPPVPAPPAPALNSDVFFGPQQTATALYGQSPVVYKLGSSVCR
jgi:hypothetical protein